MFVHPAIKGSEFQDAEHYQTLQIMAFYQYFLLR